MDAIAGTTEGGIGMDNKECQFCQEHEADDELYEYSPWEGGIGFDRIKIRFCPLCGAELKTVDG